MSDPRGYTEAEGYAASLRQQAKWLRECNLDGSIDAEEFDAAADFIEHAAVFVERSEWRDISTAPRDGSDILVYRPLAHEHGDPSITVAKTTDRPRPSPHGVQHYTDRAHHPTHWMPLPAPPMKEVE